MKDALKTFGFLLLLLSVGFAYKLYKAKSEFKNSKKSDTDIYGRSLSEENKSNTWRSNDGLTYFEYEKKQEKLINSLSKSLSKQISSDKESDSLYQLAVKKIGEEV